MSEQIQTAEILFQLSGVGVVETDMRTGRFRRANAAFCAVVGYSEAELRGMTYLELTHPDDRERDSERFAALQRGEVQGCTSLMRALHKGGQVVWLELHVTVLGEGEERVNLTVVNDVTERQETDEALRASEERYRTLIASIDEGHLLAEVLYDDEERPIDLLYLEENPAAIRITGVPEYAGRRLLEIDPGFERYWLEIWDRVTRTGVSERLERYAAPLHQWYDFQVARGW